MKFKLVLLLCLFCVTVSQAQYGITKWEAGVNLIPITDKQAAYTLIFKRYLSERNALRFGAGGRYQKVMDEDYLILSDQVMLQYFKLSYEYELERQNYQVVGFLGIQYVKGSKKLSLYGATDLIFNYIYKKVDAPDGIKYIDTNLPIPSYYITLEVCEEKQLEYGIRQSLGIQYHLNPQLSISLEGGVTFNRNKESYKNITYALQTYNQLENPISSVGYVAILHPWREDWNQSFEANLISLLSINYHF